jgi:hypothetical protein
VPTQPDQAPRPLQRLTHHHDDIPGLRCPKSPALSSAQLDSSRCQAARSQVRKPHPLPIV